MPTNKIIILLVCSILIVILLTIRIVLFGQQTDVPEVHAEKPTIAALTKQVLPAGIDDDPEAKTSPTYPTITPVPVTQATVTPTAFPLQAFNGIDNESESGSLENIPLDHAEFDYVFSIGHSIEGRELTMYRFGSGESHRLIIAGIHGGYEYNTTDLAFELITYLANNPDFIPADVTLFILPTLNPDGLAYSKWYEGRSNANGVDLNRNWDFNWKNTWQPDGCWSYLPIHGGEQPFSEPETVALRNFIANNNIEAIISYHSAALGIFAGGMPSNPISLSLAEAVSLVALYTFPPQDTGCEMTGQFIDYTASHGIPSLDIELANHRDTDFEINLRLLNAFLIWNQ